ncbi:hypothetical protein BD560DRAFT_369448 [Blakeslea trispora]|nr:hypothetical protein BD560DRAFT_369448 [Blakeslea trispora]
MQPSITLRAAHKPLIRFLGPRANLWKGKREIEGKKRLVTDTPHHVGPHPMTPPNLVKHVAQPSSAPTPKANTGNKQVLEFGQLDAKYRRTPISELEMDAIESGGATAIF